MWTYGYGHGAGEDTECLRCGCWMVVEMCSSGKGHWDVNLLCCEKSFEKLLRVIIDLRVVI